MDRLRETLTNSYGIQMLDASPINYGMYESTWKVSSDRGAIFVKRVERQRDPARMLRGLTISEKVREQGFPAPRVLPGSGGELLTRHLDSYYVVTEWINGRCLHPGELGTAEARNMGAALGRLHRLMGKVDEQPFEHSAISPAIVRCREQLKAYEQHQDKPFGRYAYAILQQQHQRLTEIPEADIKSLAKTATAGIKFCSFWCEQLLFDSNGEVVALVDWTDGAGTVGHWIEDLAVGLWLSGPSSERAIDIPVWQAMVSGYQEVNPLCKQDWLALADHVWYGWLTTTGYTGGWLTWRYRRQEEWEQIAPLWLQQIPWLYDHRDEVKDCIMRAVGY